MKMKFTITPRMISLWIFCLAFTYLFESASAIRCYQCSSDTDKDNDVCGAYTAFDKVRNVPVECYSEDARTPGVFCVKVVKQGPRVFIWDGRWRTVIRRCALVSETGVTNYCNWGHDENGVYWEECYCATNECNAASSVRFHYIMAILPFLALLLTLKRQ
ncbi:hypothetical protein CHUAL_005099 [Chamberlinius hualienensis]